MPTIFNIPSSSKQVGYAPANVSGLSIEPANEQLIIKWSDPADTIVDGITLAKWEGTKVVRKAGSYPENQYDGTVLVDNKVRDSFKDSGYTDGGLTNGMTYYYGVFPYSTTNQYNLNEANRVSAIPQAYVKYGIRWYYKAKSPTLERLYDSENFTFQAKSATQNYHSDFDGKPIYKDIKTCNVVNGVVTAYEGETGFTRSGTNGDVMVEIPKFWYKVEASGTYRDFVISDIPLDGFLVAPRHMACDDYPNGLDKIYVGAYEATSGFKSVSGVAPFVNKTRAQFRAGFANRGAGYCQADWATQFELEILMMVETASLNTQSAVGNGNAISSAAVNTGGTDNLGAVTGTAGSNNPVVWRGIENLWGNVNEWRDGINFDNVDIYVCLNPSKFADYTATNYTKIGYSKLQRDGHISETGFDTNNPWVQIPTVVSGSSSTYLCDYYYYNSGWTVASVGGNWTSDSNAGLFSLYAYGSSNSLYYIGSRLLVLPS
jgi:hypothetical protein